MPLATYAVPGTANYNHPVTGVPQRFILNDVIPLETAILYGMPGAAAQPDVTATAAGDGTGVVPAGVPWVVVSSGNAAHKVTLPTPVVGKSVQLKGGATAYELRTSAPATIALNGGTGAAASSTVGADLVVTCLADSATSWRCTSLSAAGAVAAVEAAS